MKAGEDENNKTTKRNLQEKQQENNSKKRNTMRNNKQRRDGKMRMGKITREELQSKIISCLNEDFRMPITDMARNIGVPTSTIWEEFKRTKPKIKCEITIDK